MDLNDFGRLASIGSFLIALLINWQKIKAFLGGWWLWLYSVLLIISGVFAGVFIASPYINSLTSHDVILSWGTTHQGFLDIKIGIPESVQGVKSSTLIVNGSALRFSERKDYKLIGVCFHYWISGDLLDQPNVSKSGLYDIRDGHITITIQWNDQFVRELVKPMLGTTYVLLEVPKGVTPDDFTTVRKAVDLGARILQSRVGTP